MTFVKSLPLKASQSTMLPTSNHLKKYDHPLEHSYVLPECGTRQSYHLGGHCELCKKAEREYRRTLKHIPAERTD